MGLIFVRSDSTEIRNGCPRHAPSSLHYTYMCVCGDMRSVVHKVDANIIEKYDFDQFSLMQDASVFKRINFCIIKEKIYAMLKRREREM